MTENRGAQARGQRAEWGDAPLLPFAARIRTALPRMGCSPEAPLPANLRAGSRRTRRARGGPCPLRSVKTTHDRPGHSGGAHRLRSSKSTFRGLRTPRAGHLLFPGSRLPLRSVARAEGTELDRPSAPAPVPSEGRIFDLGRWGRGVRWRP